MTVPDLSRRNTGSFFCLAVKLLSWYLINSFRSVERFFPL